MNEFKLTQINMVMLGVEDLERSLAFYRDRLGLSVRNQIPGFAFLDAGAITLVLSEPLAKASESKGEAVEIVFPVQHVKPAFEALRERGVVFLNEPRNVNGPFWAANFHDPDDHLLSIFGNE
jgi:catechol 2,3-dioxygenase-like lactoylglutathione lyase family enzyme